MTYNVFGGTLNLAQSINFMPPLVISQWRHSAFRLSMSAYVHDHILQVVNMVDSKALSAISPNLQLRCSRGKDKVIRF